MTKFDNLISGYIKFGVNPYIGTQNEGYFEVAYKNRIMFIESHKSLKHTFTTIIGEQFSQYFLEKWATLDPTNAMYKSTTKKKVDLNKGI